MKNETLAMTCFPSMRRHGTSICEMELLHAQDEVYRVKTKFLGNIANTGSQTLMTTHARTQTCTKRNLGHGRSRRPALCGWARRSSNVFFLLFWWAVLIKGAGTKGKTPDVVPASVQFTEMVTKAVKYKLSLKKQINYCIARIQKQIKENNIRCRH